MRTPTVRLTIGRYWSALLEADPRNHWLDELGDDSVCGVLIISICASADALLVHMHEPKNAKAIRDAVVAQCHVIYFG